MDKLVIFDCDGTLVDSEVVAAKVFTSYWATHGVYLTELEFKEKFIGKGNHHPDSIDLFKRMPPHAIEEGDRRWDEALRDSLLSVNGMIELLSSLKCNLSVGSNSSIEHITRALNQTGLARFFGENVFSASSVANPKPAPDLFLHIARFFNISRENCIVVEDSVSGVRAARNAGMKVIAFSGAAHFVPSMEERLKEEGPDWICSNTRELGLLLSQFLMSAPD
jgi:beta-phosphoglucomutase-like phosphatase (HAD superfamily)